MDDPMNPEARRVIAEVRLSRTPSVDDKERIRKVLAIGVAVAAASVPATAAGVAAAKAGAGGVAAKAAGAAGLAVGLKTAVSVVVLASVGAGAYVLTRPEPAPRSHAPKVVTARPVPAPAPPVVEEAPPPVAPVVETHVAPAHSGRDPLLAELSLLHHARQAWRTGNASRALSLAQEHAHRYPHSALGLERDALRVFALCALGQKAQARPLADDLLRRAPNSPLRTSVEESCGGR